MRMFFLGIMGIFVLGGCAGKDDTQREQELSRSEEGQETVKIEQIINWRGVSFETKRILSYFIWEELGKDKMGIV